MEFFVGMSTVSSSIHFYKLFSTSGNSERLSWERSTQEILLKKLKFALRNHQVHEAWESFKDFRRLYGYPEIGKEKYGLLHADTLTKLALSPARLQMSSFALVILRLMLDKGCVPSMHLLSLIVCHTVKIEAGTHVASNYLFQILEMNGLRDEMKELEVHIDVVSATYVRHYRLFYDSLLSLHFKFNDVDVAAKLVLDMTSSHNCCVNKEYREQLQKPCFIAIGSLNLRAGLKIYVELEPLHKDSVLKVESREELIFYRGGKLVLGNKAVARFIYGYKEDGRISELSKLLLRIQEEQYSVIGSGLCSGVIGACIVKAGIHMCYSCQLMRRGECK
ncbi:hypothetical protein RJT34_30959 [Clitoria ternatea]|uniref:Uncharacterized protein n=1 Tax=Clitoria ternatea TaxID=43366 RepID=A0AAN9EVJ2_CLITE